MRGSNGRASSSRATSLGDDMVYTEVPFRERKGTQPPNRPPTVLARVWLNSLHDTSRQGLDILRFYRINLLFDK